MSTINECLIQQDLRRKIKFKNQFKNSRAWPDCFEKSLITCIYYVSLSEHDKLRIANLDDILLKECNKMRERLCIEGIENEDYKETLECLKVVFENRNEISSQKEMEKMMNNLRILDINRIRELVTEIEKVSEKLKDKDIILFLGPTGCGKSMI